MKQEAPVFEKPPSHPCLQARANRRRRMNAVLEAGTFAPADAGTLDVQIVAVQS